MNKLKMLLLFFMISVFHMSDVYATGDNSITAKVDKGETIARVICNIIIVLNGPISQAIATLIIIITGYSFFIGKVSIGMLFIVAGGILFVFGAQSIAALIFGEGFTCAGGSIRDPSNANGGKS